jgi:7-cyano-7-deazaguanine synthase
MIKRIDAILLASGGLDSTTLAYWLRSHTISFVPLFVDYGQHCAKTEIETLRSVLPADTLVELDTIRIDDIYKWSASRLIKPANLWADGVEYADLYVPYRNLLLLTVGSAYAQSRGASALYSAFINSNHAIEIDCSAVFFENLSALLASYGSVKVEMPFRNMSKREVCELGISLRVPIGKTFSCQASPDFPCGACPNCVDRLDALEQLHA